MAHTQSPTDMPDERQLAEELQIPERTLAMWRYRKIGPPYVKIGRRVRYRRADIDAWLAAQTVQPVTT